MHACGGNDGVYLPHLTNCLIDRGDGACYDPICNRQSIITNNPYSNIFLNISNILQLRLEKSINPDT